jgi:tRNA G18 (ribose-2'-O)-methylase SpoU
LAQTILILDNIQDPANTGTIFRCASAFGISNIAFTGNCVKPNNRKFLRGCQGSILDINHQSFPSLNDLLKKSEIRNYNIYLTSSKKSHRTLDVEQINFPSLIIIGNEGSGLSEDLFLKYPSLKIPQKPTIESLNAGVSACIIMYEISKLI